MRLRQRCVSCVTSRKNTNLRAHGDRPDLPAHQHRVLVDLLVHPHHQPAERRGSAVLNPLVHLGRRAGRVIVFLHAGDVVVTTN